MIRVNWSLQELVDGANGKNALVASMADLRKDLQDGRIKLIKNSCEIVDRNGESLLCYFSKSWGRSRNGGQRTSTEHGISVSSHQEFISSSLITAMQTADSYELLSMAFTRLPFSMPSSNAQKGQEASRVVGYDV